MQVNENRIVIFGLTNPLIVILTCFVIRTVIDLKRMRTGASFLKWKDANI